MKAPVQIETARLSLRQPGIDDALAIFERYASDPEVTRFLGWPRHRTVEDTQAFLQFSAAEWERWPAGPYLILSRADGLLLGSTGLGFQTSQEAVTGYVLAEDAWGRGYATEALAAMIEVAGRTGVIRLYALCHPEHGASRRVLEKNGFVRDDPPTRRAEFPNLAPGVQQDALCYALSLDGTKGSAQQADAADEGRLEASRITMVGQGIVNQGKVVRPSQLIRRVGF
jgi:RimJ/RimL family protein N-acetyltransferase